MVLPGNHDGNIAWDPHLVEVIRERLGPTTFALAVDLTFDTGAGPQKVHVVHGNQDDPYNALHRPAVADRHARRATTSCARCSRSSTRSSSPAACSDGLTWLAEPTQAGEMVGSRLLYRKVVGRVWWLGVPFFAALALRLVAFLPRVERVLRGQRRRAGSSGLGDRR